MIKRKYPSQEFIKECFTYEGGKLFWKERPSTHFKNGKDVSRWNTLYSGKLAGHKWRSGRKKEVYRWKITIQNSDYFRSILIWIYFYGDIPHGYEIDHINNDTLDDKIDNLRLATPQQQIFNQNIRRSNTSGFKGVSFHKQLKKYSASITVRGETIHLGVFVNPEDAHKAYIDAAKEYAGEYSKAG